MDREDMKRAVCAEIDRRREDIVRVAQTMLRHPELGYKEHRTAALVKGELEALGLPVREGLAITGVDGTLEGGQPGPTLYLMGELDAVISPEAPIHDPATGAAHQCGHHIQVASMLGAAMGLVGAGIAGELAGRIRFLGVPAEEFVEIEYRLGLVEEGKIGFLGGKPELIRQGYFDEGGIAMMVHSFPNAPEPGFYFGARGNGFLAKFVQYVGRAAHAGAAPHEGINALNAACLGILAIHAQRETFRDEDAIRVHPIVTKGGDVVNIVPADVRLETYVRGKTVEAILDASRKVDRALRAGGDAVGAQTRIRNVPGYLPLFQDERLTALGKANGRALLGERGTLDAGFLGGSFDVGDLAHLMPVLHPLVGGTQGALHGKDFAVVDYEAAAVLPAKLLAMCAVDLLADGAREAREVIANYRAPLTKEQYLALMADLAQ
ncbi:MAG: amidohydrolase [Anaerolineae bacterium]